MCRSSLLFRGVCINKKWVKDFRRVIGFEDQNGANLLQITIATKNLDIALEASKCHLENAEDDVPVLFIYSMWNYTGLLGWKNDDDKFTPYKHDQEEIIMDGVIFYILAVQDNFEITNEHASLQQYNGKKITIIYC